MRNCHFEYITLLLLSGALAWLMYIGIPKPWGIVVAILIGACAVLHPYLHGLLARKYPGFNKDFYFPVLGFAVITAVSLIVLFVEGQSPFMPVLIMLALGGSCGVIGWIMRRGYRKPIKQLWKEDLYIASWGIDVVIILLFLFDLLQNQKPFSWSVMLIMIVAFADIINQLFMRKTEK